MTCVFASERRRGECKGNPTYRTDEAEKWLLLPLHVKIRQELAQLNRSG